MAETDDCRYCAACCSDCVFLEYDKEANIFGCLIYENKFRGPLYSKDVPNGLKCQYAGDAEHLFYMIDSIVRTAVTNSKHQSQLCDNYRCGSMLERKKLMNDIRKVKNPDFPWFQSGDLLDKTLKDIERARNMIPDFQDLVQVLKANIEPEFGVMSGDKIMITDICPDFSLGSISQKYRELNPVIRRSQVRVFNLDARDFSHTDPFPFRRIPLFDEDFDYRWYRGRDRRL